MKTKDYLIFELQGLRYGIEISQVQEIFKLPDLKAIIDVPNNVIGILNLRNSVVPVIHISKHLSIGTPKFGVDDSLIIIHWQEFQLGLVVQTIYDIQSVNMADIELIKADDTKGNSAIGCAAGTAQIHEQLTLLLSLDALIQQPDEMTTLIWEVKLNGLQPPRANVLPKLAGMEPEPSQSITSEFIARYCPNTTRKEQEMLRQRAVSLGQPLGSIDANSDRSLAVVTLDDTCIGIALEHIREFANVAHVTSIPGSPPHIIGNINLRGEILTLIDIRAALGLSPTDLQASKAIIVEIDDVVAGIAINDVLDVIELLPSDLLPPDSETAQIHPTFSQGAIRYYRHLSTIIDLPKLFYQGNIIAEHAA